MEKGLPPMYPLSRVSPLTVLQRIAPSLKSDTSFGPTNHKKVARIIKKPWIYKALPNAADASPPGVSLVAG